MTTLRLTAALWVLFTVACLQAQSTAEPRFEAASVKRNTSGGGTTGPGIGVGQVAIRNEPLQIILGLKVEPATASEDVWIVDHVERPWPD